MNRLRVSTATMVLMLASGGTACHKQKVVVVPPAPAPPAKVVTLPEHKPESPPLIPPAPELQPAKTEANTTPEVLTPQPITVKPPRRRAASRPQQGPAVPPAPAPNAPPAPVAPPVPQLKPILNAEQERQLNASIEKRLERARQVVKSTAGRQLTQQQTATIQQIQTFIQQSEAERKTDLVRANNLAERADVLSQDLQRGLP